ncbi:MAG: ATP-binding cassette domain-containing protein [Nitriliruptorales bacterium]|nr:ATP-binding cassette domain-containing protein [Nitriliruptorales bacterium]
MSAALTTRRLTKTYKGVAAVDALDLAVDPGTLFGFLGPNGAGKSTTIRMLLGLVRPTSGEVEVLGEPMGPGRGMAALRRVGALIEDPAFWNYLSGRRNLEYFARAAGPDDGREARLGRIDEVLETVELTAAAGKKVKAYSHGMRQRLGIARALLGAPELLILDEPTNGLDPQGIAEIRSLLRRLADGGTTVFVSSHLLAEVEAMCDRVGVLAHGRLVADGPPSNLRASSARLRVGVDDPSRAERILAGLPGVTVETVAGVNGALRVRLAEPATPAGVNASLVQAGVAVHELAQEHERLEDVFLDLVGGASVPR